MDAGVTAALIASGASILVAGVSATMTIRAQRREIALTSEQVMERYRRPLVGAAMDLQTRLHNVLGGDLFVAYAAPGSPRREETILTTLYRFAQYFGWSEALNRDLYYLPFEEPGDTRRIRELLAEVMRAFNTDRLGEAFMLWRDEQRAIGELMLSRQGDSLTCMGYASFVHACRTGTSMARWLMPMERWLQELAERSGDAAYEWPPGQRLQVVQSILCDLVRELDPKGLQSSVKLLDVVRHPLSEEELRSKRAEI